MTDQIQTELLPVELLEHEVREKGEELARLIARHDAIKDAHKQAAKQQKEELEGVNLEIREIGEEVRTRKERRRVEVQERFYPEKGNVATVRMDTGEVVRTRAMSPAEKEASRQGTLFRVHPGASAEA